MARILFLKMLLKFDLKLFKEYFLMNYQKKKKLASSFFNVIFPKGLNV